MELSIWWTVAVAAVSFLIGMIFCESSHRKDRIGTLRIDRSDPNEPAYFFLEIENAKRIADGKTVSMRVKEENYISQE